MMSEAARLGWCKRDTGEVPMECQIVCTLARDNIVNAGGTDILKATSCPIEAAYIIGSGEGEQFAGLRQRLGIVGVFEGVVEHADR